MTHHLPPRVPAAKRSVKFKLPFTRKIKTEPGLVRTLSADSIIAGARVVYNAATSSTLIDLTNNPTD
jgi:hypothetical protein